MIYVFMQSRPFFGSQITHVNSLNSIRKRFPERHIRLFCKYSSGQMCPDLGVVDSWSRTDKAALLRQVGRERPKYVFSFGPSNNFPILLAFLSGARYIAFKNKYNCLWPGIQVPYDDCRYRGDNFQRLLAAHDIPFLQYVPEKKQDTAGDILFMPGGVSGCVPGTLRGVKKWGVKRYYRLYEKLRAAYPDLALRFVLGPDEVAEYEWLQSRLEPVAIVRSPDLASLFDCVQRSRLVIANDCGPVHVVHMLRKNLVELFDKPKAEWFLSRDNAIALHGTAGDIQTITDAEVFGACEHLLGTEPRHDVDVSL